MSSLVSVCITTFNRKELLPLTLKSILDQTYKNIEIIIVDDCSIDGTQFLVENEILKLDPRIKYIRHAENNGLAFARNTGIFNAKGKYFTFCDDDDLLMPNYIEEFMNVASIHDDNWCFCCSGKYKNFLGTYIETSFEYEGELKSFIKKGFTPPVSSQFYNLLSLKKINGYNQNVKSGVDHDLWIRLAISGFKIKYIAKQLSLPNPNTNQRRMTTNYEERLSGIKNSLQIWENDLIEMYGNKFFLEFSDAYLQRERLKFFNNYLQDFNLVMAFKIKKDISLFSCLRAILILLTKKTLKYIVPKIFISKKKILKIKPTLKIKNF